MENNDENASLMRGYHNTVEMPAFVKRDNLQKTDSSRNVRSKACIKEVSQGEIEIDCIKEGLALICETGKSYIVLDRKELGGTAEIWRVKDEQEKEYAAKIYFDSYNNKHIDEFYQEFYGKEVEGLMPILDCGKIIEEGKRKRSFYITPLYTEMNLDKYLDENEMTSEEIIEFIRVICVALHTMHTAGFYHCDIKPENILYDGSSKRTKLIDYGSIKKRGGPYDFEVSITSNRQVTDGYTAPEISGYYAATEGRKVIASEKTDFFSLGVTIAEIFKILELRHEKGSVYGENGIRQDTRIFANDGDVFLYTVNNMVKYPLLLKEEERVFELVQELLRFDPKTRAGYKEVCEWLKKQ